MKKVLISLLVPEQAQQFDLFVPTDIPVKTLITIMVEGIDSLNSRKTCLSGKEMLVLQKKNAVLHPNKTLSVYPISDGDKLILL